MSDAPKAPPGWYPSPTVADVEQWWDGEQWTTRARAAEGPAPAPAPSRPRPAPSATPAKPAAVSPADAVLYRTPQAREELDSADRGLVAMSFILAILLPFVGFIMGIVVATKRNHGADGAMIMVVSVIATAVWAQVLA